MLNSTVEAVQQTVHPVDSKRKTELLVHLVKEQQWFQVLVFTRTKHGANRLAEQLDKDGISALAIHGNKSQGARTRALAEFKSGDLQVLAFPEAFPNQGGLPVTVDGHTIGGVAASGAPSEWMKP